MKFLLHTRRHGPSVTGEEDEEQAADNDGSDDQSYSDFKSGVTGL